MRETLNSNIVIIQESLPSEDISPYENQDQIPWFLGTEDW